MVQRIHPSLSVPSGTSLVRVLGFQQIASHFRDGIDKGEGDLSRRFDLARFSDFIGLRPLERVILAASIVATPTGKELATQASSIIQVEFHNAVCALSFEPSDLSRDQIEKLLSDLLSKPPTGPPVLDATQRETLIVAAQSKYGKDTINPMVQRIHPSLSVPSGTSLVRVLIQLGLQIAGDPNVIRALLMRFNISDTNPPRAGLVVEITSTLRRLDMQGTPMCDVDVDLEKWLANNCGSGLSGELGEGPPVWPVIIWVAFQQTRNSYPISCSEDIGALITVIESKADEYIGLWTWDDTDEQMLREKLISQNGATSSWIDHYPPAWWKYILLLGPEHWTRLGASTRRSSRPRLDPSGYDTAIRLGAIVLWTSISDSSEINTMLSLEGFLHGDVPRNYREFLTHLLESRAPVDLNVGPEAIDWHNPRIWLDRTSTILRSSVLHGPETIPLVHVVEKAYMVYHVSRVLPQHFMSSVFACLLKKFGGDTRLDDFRARINIWKRWNAMTCLVNFRSVLSTTLEFSKLLEEQDLPRALITDMIRTDMCCICAQFANILRDSNAYKKFFKTQDDNAQELLDLLQGVRK
ncbi:hypothetical protein B0H14DRAFT_1213429 [Mycena olivaceomarginata]|nr:hypothetical protein B0H14DRAFT_1213429 [Mycena olivaceomarginata]